MHAYHYRFFVGPTVVSQVSAMLRAAAMPWQHVTIEGTEHVHVSILALHSDAALREMAQWPNRAGLDGRYRFEFLRRDDSR